jgi:hypothetical protein
MPIPPRRRTQQQRRLTRLPLPLLLAGGAFICFWSFQAFLWWGFDGASHTPLALLFASSSAPPSPLLPPPDQADPCHGIAQELYNAQQRQLAFCASSGAAASTPPDYLRSLPLTCPMSELSLGAGRGRRRKQVDRNVTFFGYVAKDIVRKVKREGEKRSLRSSPSSHPPSAVPPSTPILLGKPRRGQARLLGKREHVHPPLPSGAGPSQAA